MKAILALEDGRYFEGASFGAAGERSGEIVFNTGMTGYQEVLTDPSYKGQIVAMTYPLIGNYGVNDQDNESRALWLEGFVIGELSRRARNWRSSGDLDSLLRIHDVPGICGVDTRALTRHIREAGAMRAVISTRESDPAVLVERAKKTPGLVGRDLVKEVSSPDAYELGRQGGPLVAVLDFGVKSSILQLLQEAGCRVKVLNARATADEIMRLNPDGVLLSNGPGDPAAVTYAVETVRELINEGNVPLFGICLGHQLMGLALGGKTYKLKFGHHGSNHPVKDKATGKIYITVQNHGFCVDAQSLDTKVIEVTHVNLYDGTLEGIRHKVLPVFSVQFHPEAGPGPHDARSLFSDFVESMKKRSEQ